MLLTNLLHIHLQIFVIDSPAAAPGLPQSSLSATPSSSHIVRMLDSTTPRLMEPAIEAYAIVSRRLAYTVCDLLTAIRCVTMHIIAILIFPIFLLSITFKTIVTTLMSMTLPQNAPHHPAPPTHDSPTSHSVDLYESSSNSSGNSSVPIDLKYIGHVDGLLTDIPEGCVRSATVVKINGRLQITPADPPPGNYLGPPPAIPSHLKNCEFYYNSVDIDLIEHTSRLQNGQPQVVRVTVDEHCRTCAPGYAKVFLESLEAGRLVSFKDDGGVELSDSKRGKLEMTNRVYVGPVDWLLRVLIEEV